MDELAATAARAPQAARKPLAAYRVDHTATVGMTWQEIDALRPPFVIDGFLRRGELLLLGAESKSRKSWLAQDAALCVAGGLPWLADADGNGGFATAQAAVHVVDLELAQSECRFRFAKARNNRFLDHGARLAITARVNSYSLDGLPALESLALIDELKQGTAPGDLVIVDCFYRLQADGNETEIVAGIMETLKRFASDTQAAVVVVDHFRKAGADKARDRFAGSFVKHASPATLVAIEVIGADVLKLSIDARTFHGEPVVHCRFNSASYTFERVDDQELAAMKAGATADHLSERLVQLYKARPLGDAVKNADAVAAWQVTREAVRKIMERMTAAGLLELSIGEKGAHQWKLSPNGREIVVQVMKLHHTTT